VGESRWGAAFGVKTTVKFEWGSIFAPYLRAKSKKNEFKKLAAMKKSPNENGNFAKGAF